MLSSECEWFNTHNVRKDAWPRQCREKEVRDAWKCKIHFTKCFQKLSSVSINSTIARVFSGEGIFILLGLHSGKIPGMQDFHLGSFLQGSASKVTQEATGTTSDLAKKYHLNAVVPIV